jgi:hypothetical protein
MPAYLHDGLLWRGGRHVAALRGAVLSRTFDAGRELFRGALLFHCDVVALAQAHGARWLLATERGSGQRYRIALGDFVRLAWPYSHPTFGAQRGLELTRWQRLPAEGEAEQLALFGAGASR